LLDAADFETVRQDRKPKNQGRDREIARDRQGERDRDRERERCKLPSPRLQSNRDISSF
jgi:hypothetical protein